VVCQAQAGPLRPRAILTRSRLASKDQPEVNQLRDSALASRLSSAKVANVLGSDAVNSGILAVDELKESAVRIRIGG
jgi:hypothetical protein